MKGESREKKRNNQQVKKVLIAKRILLIKSIGNKGIIVWIIFMMILSSHGLAAELFLGAEFLLRVVYFITQILLRSYKGQRYEFPSSNSAPLNPMQKQNPSKS